MHEYQTDRSRAWRALVKGAATGAGIVAFLFLVLILWDEGVVRSVQTLPFVAFAFICAFAAWAVDPPGRHQLSQRAASSFSVTLVQSGMRWLSTTS
jgi:hypothetical protein